MNTNLHKINDKMPTIKVNDVFDELNEENKRLQNELLFANKCLDVLNKFKSYLIAICDKLRLELTSKEIDKLQQLQDEYERVFNEKQITSIDQHLDDVNKTFRNNENSKSSNSYYEDHNNNCHEVREQNLRNNNNQLCETNMKIDKKSTKGSNNIKSISFNFEKIGKYYKCDYIGCNYKTLRRCQLLGHKNKHIGLLEYKCTYEGCCKAFAGLKNLRDHIRVVHTLQKTIECNFFNCGKKFKTNSELNTHMKRHSNEKPFTCDYPNCDYRATTKGQIVFHKSSHSNERPFKCSFDGCFRSFKTDYILKVHLSTHAIRPQFKCQTIGCNSVFNSEVNLKKHHRFRHSDEAPILSCDWPGCEFTTKRNDSIKRHKLIHSDNFNFVCDWPECGKKFRVKDKLGQHLRIHRNDKRYVCHWPGCQYRCVDSANFRKHFKIHERNCLQN